MVKQRRVDADAKLRDDFVAAGFADVYKPPSEGESSVDYTRRLKALRQTLSRELRSPAEDVERVCQQKRAGADAKLRDDFAAAGFAELYETAPPEGESSVDYTRRLKALRQTLSRARAPVPGSSFVARGTSVVARLAAAQKDRCEACGVKLADLRQGWMVQLTRNHGQLEVRPTTAMERS